MQCDICYEEIKEHKLFKAGCCSISLCVSCVKENKLKKCPQCKASYIWINETEVMWNLKKTINDLNEKIDTLKLSAGFAWIQSRKSEDKLKEMKYEHELIMQEMVNTIIKLIDDKEQKEENEENERHIKSVIERYHLNLI